MGLFGLAFYGPVSGAWYSWLDATVLVNDPTSAAAVGLKTGADQVLWAPVLITTLFAWDLAWSSSATHHDNKWGVAGVAQLPSKLKQDLLPTLLVNWTFWPLFHVLNFRFVAPPDRILYVNVVQVPTMHLPSPYTHLAVHLTAL